MGGRTQLEKLVVPEGPRPTAAAAGLWLTSGLQTNARTARKKQKLFISERNMQMVQQRIRDSP